MIRVEVYVGPEIAKHPNNFVVRKPILDAMADAGLGDRMFPDALAGTTQAYCCLDFPDKDAELYLAGRLVFEINKKEGYCAKSQRV